MVMLLVIILERESRFDNITDILLFLSIQLCFLLIDMIKRYYYK